MTTALKSGNSLQSGGEIANAENVTTRFSLVGLGLVLAALLITARAVEPASDGFGTHQRLGLPPCGFRFIFGRPCPSCGMTTSWSLLMRGQLAPSAQANPGGMLLAMSSLIATPWLILSGLRGKWFLVPPLLTPISVVGIAIVLTTVANWLIKLYE